MSEEIISIIVPIYNVGAYLEKCIQSIVNQTYKNLQIILVDDGSTDGSAQTCDRYQEQDERILVIHKENGGLVSARKAGISEAVGEFIGYVDADDWIEPDMYENLFTCMKKTGADIVDTDYYMETGEIQKLVKSKMGYGFFQVEEMIPTMLCDENFNECRLKPYIWSKLFRKELLTSVQLSVDEAISCGEDAAVVYPYLLKSKSIYILEYSGYHYVQRIGSITNIGYSDELERNKVLFQYLKACFETSKYKMVLLEQLNQYAKMMLLLRQISFFDEEAECLTPFGGVRENERIVIYGAGKLGQSMYKYLSNSGRVQIVDWFDKEYVTYQSNGLPVHNPNELLSKQNQVDKIMVAVNGGSVAKAIKKDLLNLGIAEEKMFWLTDRFVDRQNDILSIVIRS